MDAFSTLKWDFSKFYDNSEYIGNKTHLLEKILESFHYDSGKISRKEIDQDL